MKWYHLVIANGLLALVAPKAAAGVAFLIGFVAIVLWMGILAGGIGRKRQ